METSSYDVGEGAWRALMLSRAAVLQLLEDEMQAEQGVSLVVYEVLMHLFEAPNQQLRMQELTGRVLLTQSGASRLVDRLEAGGLAQRVATDSDRRGTCVVLTPRGMQVAQDAGQVHLRGVHEHFVQHLTVNEQQVLKRALVKVLRHAAVAGARAAQIPDLDRLAPAPDSSTTPTSAHPDSNARQLPRRARSQRR